jgi:hypothetical protein
MAYPPYQNRLYGHAWFSATANATIGLEFLYKSQSNHPLTEW